MYFLMGKPAATGRVLWIIDSVFRFTHFGICSMLRGDFFISSVSTTRAVHRVRYTTCGTPHAVHRVWYTTCSTPCAAALPTDYHFFLQHSIYLLVTLVFNSSSTYCLVPTDVTAPSGRLIDWLLWGQAGIIFHARVTFAVTSHALDIPLVVGAIISHSCCHIFYFLVPVTAIYITCGTFTY